MVIFEGEVVSLGVKPEELLQAAVVAKMAAPVSGAAIFRRVEANTRI
jgi:hypothetical protein